MLVFTDRVLASLYHHIGRHEPERGGALLSFPWTNWIVAYVDDPGAAVTRASYIPSAWLTKQVQALERSEGYRFAGVVHSHPGSADQPSGPDRYAFGKGLELNPHLAAFVAPILTRDRSANPGEKGECPIAEGVRMNTFLAYRTASTPPQAAMHAAWPSPKKPKARFSWLPLGKTEAPLLDDDFVLPPSAITRTAPLIRLAPTEVVVMPIAAHINRVAAEIAAWTGRPAQGTPGRNIQIGGAWHITEDVAFAGGSLTFLFSAAYPAASPAVLLHLADADDSESRTIQLHLEWPLFGGDADDTLWRRLEPHIQTLRRPP